jgi:hypothetical protein
MVAAPDRCVVAATRVRCCKLVAAGRDLGTVGVGVYRWGLLGTSCRWGCCCCI